MRHILAAIDNSAAAQPVLEIATAFAELLDGELSAVHVRERSATTARAVARRAGLDLRILEGDPVPTLIRTIADHEPDLVVVGSRGRPEGRRPAGHTTLELAQHITRPLLIVPPDSTTHRTLSRALVPLDASLETTAAVRSTAAMLSDAGLEVVAVHVLDPEHVPRFVDQPQHDYDTRRHEFIARYTNGTVPLELRSGIARDGVLRCAHDVDADLIVLCWAQDLSTGHADVVREALTRSSAPVLLLPLDRRTSPDQTASDAPSEPRAPADRLKDE
jgi:nucleotide-binding universal stress UspA family protein